MNTAWSKQTKYLVGAGLAIFGIYVLYLSRSVIPLLIIATLLAVIVRPFVNMLQVQFHLKHGLAVAITYLIVVILVPLVMLLAVPAIVDALGYVVNLDYQGFYQRGVEWFRSTLVGIKAIRFPGPAFDAYVDQSVDSILVELQEAESSADFSPPTIQTILQSLGAAVSATFDAAAGLVGALFSQIATLIFLFLASIYISLDMPTYRAAFLRRLPASYQPEIDRLLTRIVRMWNAYFRGQITLMIVIGILSWFGLSVLGVPGALYLAIIAGLLEIIPNIGPIFATIPAAIVALLQGSNHLPVSPLVLTGLVILFYILLQQLENSVIVPRILGEAVGLPALVVMTGVLVGASVGGILGALLATPIIATGSEILHYIYHKLMGHEPYHPEEVLPTQPASPFAGWQGRLKKLNPLRFLPAAPVQTRIDQEKPRSFRTELSKGDLADEPQEGDAEGDHFE